MSGNIYEIIQSLEKIQSEHGDLLVVTREDRHGIPAHYMKCGIPAFVKSIDDRTHDSWLLLNPEETPSKIGYYISDILQILYKLIEKYPSKTIVVMVKDYTFSPPGCYYECPLPTVVKTHPFDDSWNGFPIHSMYHTPNKNDNTLCFMNGY